MKPPSGRTALYKFYDSSAGSLYIGISSSPTTRFAAHRSTSWWKLVDPARTQIIWFDARLDAARAEAAAIDAENPQCNKARPSLDLTRCAGVGRAKWTPPTPDAAAKVARAVAMYRRVQQLEQEIREKVEGQSGEIAWLIDPNGGGVPVAYLARFLGVSRSTIYQRAGRAAA